MFLIDWRAVSLGKYLFQFRVAVADRFFLVHAPDVRVNVIHWPRPEECHHRNDVCQVVRAHLHDVARHTRAFQLEDARRAPLAETFKGLRVIQRDVVQVVAHAVAVVDQVAGALHDGEGGQPQKVHLEQTQFVDHVHLKLSHGLDGGFFGVAGRPVQGQVLQQRLIGNHHAGGVCAGITRHALHVAGGIDQVAQVIGLIVNLFKLRRNLQRVLNGHRFIRDDGRDRF